MQVAPLWIERFRGLPGVAWGRGRREVVPLFSCQFGDFPRKSPNWIQFGDPIQFWEPRIAEVKRTDSLLKRKLYGQQSTAPPAGAYRRENIIYFGAPLELWGPTYMACDRTRGPLLKDSSFNSG